MRSRFEIGKTRVVFGEGTVGQLAEELGDLGISRVLVVSDPGVMAAGLAESVETLLSGVSITYRIHDDVHPNPRASDVESAAEGARSMRAEGVVALGGGSAIDAAKAAAALAPGDSALEVLEGEEQYIQAPLPVVAIPTTAGSASEVTGWSVVTVGDRKIGIGGKALYPVLTIADPRLTVTLPPEPTAHGGMDVLTHATECYISRCTHPLAETLSLCAIRLVFQYLQRAVRAGDDLKARGRMLEASIMSGIAFASSSLGPVHAMAEAAGGAYDLPHGLLNAAFLPHVIRRYAPEIRPKMEALTQATGTGTPAFSTAVEDLALRCGIDLRLDVPFDEDALERLVEVALRDQGMGPRDLDADEMRTIFRRVLDGARNP